jgi:hypothetical protein
MPPHALISIARSSHLAQDCPALFFPDRGGGWVFDARGAYALYVIGVIGSAVGRLIMREMVKDRR